MAVKFIARFKAYKPGDVAVFEAEQESWLVSRMYAVLADDVPAPLQQEPPKKPLTTRGGSKKK